MRRLPPLAAVRAFEAAARHENFTAAAAELGLSQAGVTYQVKQLEDRLGVALFHRAKRRVTLTDAGRRAAQAATRAFDLIDGAFAELRAEDEGTLAISAPQTFANEWLAWRLGSFQTQHPGLEVQLLIDDRIVDFAGGGIDVAVRGGFGPWPGLTADRLIPIDFMPMCSRGFRDRHDPRAPEDLLRLPMVSPANPYWAIWLAAAGVAEPPGRRRRGVSLPSQANDGNAAMAGQGVAMLSPFFWRHDLALGRLVTLFDQVASDGRAYWLVAPEARRHVPKIQRFRDWIVAEVARDLGGALPCAQG